MILCYDCFLRSIKPQYHDFVMDTAIENDGVFEAVSGQKCDICNFSPWHGMFIRVETENHHWVT